MLTVCLVESQVKFKTTTTFTSHFPTHLLFHSNFPSFFSESVKNKKLWSRDSIRSSPGSSSMTLKDFAKKAPDFRLFLEISEAAAAYSLVLIFLCTFRFPFSASSFKLNSHFLHTITGMPFSFDKCSSPAETRTQAGNLEESLIWHGRT